MTGADLYPKRHALESRNLDGYLFCPVCERSFSSFQPFGCVPRPNAMWDFEHRLHECGFNVKVFSPLNVVTENELRSMAIKTDSVIYLCTN